MRWAFFLSILAAMTILVAPCATAYAQEAQPESGDQVELTIAESLEKGKALAKILEDSDDPSDPELQEVANEISKIVTFVRSRDPLNVTAGYIYARMTLVSGRPREALSLIDAYANDPAGRNDWYAFKLLGDIYLVSYASQAKSHYERAAALAPLEPEPRIGIANAELKLVRDKEAIANAQMAIQLDKENDPSYRVVLAEAYYLAAEYESAAETALEAVVLTEALVRQKPGSRKLLEDLKKRYELRVKCLDRLSSTYSDEPERLVQLVQVILDFADLERLISYHDALSLLEARIPALGDNVTTSVLYEQARLNRLVGRDDEALIVLDKLLAKDPNHAAALQLREVIEGAAVGEPTARRDDGRQP